MNRCYQCRKPIALMLKLRSLSLEPGYSCPHCHVDIGFPPWWALLCVGLSVFGGLFAGVYSIQSMSAREMLPMLLMVWAGVSLAGVLLTASLLPLIPYKDRRDIMAMMWLIPTCGIMFGLACYALFLAIWPF